jgi:hypothetical protein
LLPLLPLQQPLQQPLLLLPQLLPQLLPPVRQRWLSSAPLPLPHVQERELLERHGVRVLETPVARAIGDAAGDLAGLVLRDGCVVPLK